MGRERETMGQRERTGREDREKGGRTPLGYLSQGPEFLVTPLAMTHGRRGTNRPHTGDARTHAPTDRAMTRRLLLLLLLSAQCRD